MLRFFLGLLFTLVSSAIGDAAALIPLDRFKPTLPAAGFEPNRGQSAPDILFVSRGIASLAVTARSVLYSPFGAQLSLVASNPAPALRFADPLPGLANSFTGADARKWFTGIPRFTSAQLTDIYPGIDAEYSTGAGGGLTLTLSLRPGVDPKTIVFEITKSAALVSSADGSISARLGTSRVDPTLTYPAPVAFQAANSGPVSRKARFEAQSTTRFGLVVEAQDSALPLRIEMKLAESPGVVLADARRSVESAGATYIAASVPDAAGKDRENCGFSVGTPAPCADVAVYKYSAAGELIFVTYLAGSSREVPTFVQITPDGALVLSGGTDSADFPVTASAVQPVYGGPAPNLFSFQSPAGDYFAARLDAATGVLRASTFLGGPGADQVGETALGSDGSVYFMPKFLVNRSSGMPVTPGALQPGCTADPCLNGYAARLSPSLERLLFGTYLPGVSLSTAKLHSDGSVYYAGYASSDFPASPTAFQRQVAGGYEGIVARLDPSGSRLLFATYLGGADTDWILNLADAPDGSVWVALSSFIECCIDIRYRLIRLDGNGARILADKPIDVGAITVDREGNLFATAGGAFTVGPDALLANSCGNFSYIKLSPTGDQLFATYLPVGFNPYNFDGVTSRGAPILSSTDSRVEIVEDQSGGVFAGCVLDAPSLSNSQAVSPGSIVTLFGSRMGPQKGVAFDPWDGRAPETLGGTQVLVDGQPAAILYSSYWQLNVVLPYSLTPGARPKIQVVSNGNAGNELTLPVQRAGISLFRAEGTTFAAALNEDGSVNSPQNPAKKGSRVVLFGSGGGQTVPPSVAGEVTPLAPRWLESGVQAQFTGGPIGPAAILTVEYAGAAPGLVAGVTQINVKLPDVIPNLPAPVPRGTLPLIITAAGESFYSSQVSVAVDPQ